MSLWKRKKSEGGKEKKVSFHFFVRPESRAPTYQRRIHIPSSASQVGCKKVKSKLGHQRGELKLLTNERESWVGLLDSSHETGVFIDGPESRVDIVGVPSDRFDEAFVVGP